ncbi:MAG: SCP2 sterol-binding domain-containing protein [Proteobacteria bacterium]|nr:SCP2 sterol-binding domain-containing protein [Pseudomonadota bacterium]
MLEGVIENRAEEVPFAGILTDLLKTNLAQNPGKQSVFRKMGGTAAIDLADIETAVTLVFAVGRLRIEAGIVGKPDLVIRTASDLVTDLNLLRIVGGLPWYFDEAGRRVVAHLLTGRLKIEGLFSHPLLLTRLTKIMSVM